jgi:hypothetical protein
VPTLAQRLARLEAVLLPPHHLRAVRVYYLDHAGDALSDEAVLDAWLDANPCPGACFGVPLVQWRAASGYRYWPSG